MYTQPGRRISLIIAHNESPSVTVACLSQSGVGDEGTEQRGVNPSCMTHAWTFAGLLRGNCPVLLTESFTSANLRGSGPLIQAHPHVRLTSPGKGKRWKHEYVIGGGGRSAHPRGHAFDGTVVEHL